MKSHNFAFPYEQATVCRSLVIAAKNSSGALDKFTIWLLTAFAAALTYLLGRENSHLDNLASAGLIFLAAAMFGIVQRYVAMIVQNSAKVFKEVEKIHDPTVKMNMARFLLIYMENSAGLQRAAIAWAGEKILDGDLVATGRALNKLVFWQGIAVSICIILLMRAAFVALVGL